MFVTKTFYLGRGCRDSLAVAYDNGKSKCEEAKEEGLCEHQYYETVCEKTCGVC